MDYRAATLYTERRAYREPTIALHVHVAVADPDTAIDVLDGLRSDLPVLLALSANSPSGCSEFRVASARTPVFSMFPRTGIARQFASCTTSGSSVQDESGVRGAGALWVM